MQNGIANNKHPQKPNNYKQIEFTDAKTKKNIMAKITYYKQIEFTDAKTKGKNILITQLYAVDVYGIWNNNPAMQVIFKPQQLKKLAKKLKKAEENKEIKDLKLSYPITVDNKTGFWEEVKY